MTVDKRYRVLAVDDQDGILRALNIMLRTTAFEVVTTDSGKEAVILAEHQHFDVILLDILMPDMSGISLCAQLRNMPHMSDVPIVMLTAVNDFKQHRLALTVGAKDLLLKPVGKQVLVAKLQEMVERYPVSASAAV